MPCTVRPLSLNQPMESKILSWGMRRTSSRWRSTPSEPQLWIRWIQTFVPAFRNNAQWRTPYFVGMARLCTDLETIVFRQMSTVPTPTSELPEITSTTLWSIYTKNIAYQWFGARAESRAHWHFSGSRSPSRSRPKGGGSRLLSPPLFSQPWVLGRHFLKYILNLDENV